MAENKKTKKTSSKQKSSNKVAISNQDQNERQGLSIEKLFLKDISVEVPNSPDIFTLRETPEISIELNNNASPLPDNYFEVALQVTVTAKIDNKTAFLVDITQAGIFHINNVPAESIEPIIAVACPNILFPYAREVISDLITKAGFTAVLLNPINFEALYIQQKQQAEQN
jgi:preprotein translocase subunit SecB